MYLQCGLLENTGFILPMCILKEIKLISVDFGHKQYLWSNLSKSFLVQLWKIPQG